MAIKPFGYWNEKTIISELNVIFDELAHFPIATELSKMDKGDLLGAIDKYGGMNYFREKMGCELLKKPNGYWTEETTTSELKMVIDEIGHFPTQTELNEVDRNDLIGAIRTNGGFNHFREKMGHDTIQKPKGYWTEEAIISELKIIIEELGHFPTRDELKELSKSGIVDAMKKRGGPNHFREKMGYELLKKPDGYWTDETIIAKLESIIERLGHFPTNNDLIKMGKGDLAIQISIHGGYYYFREKMGHKLLQKPTGYWTEETIIAELESVIDELGHFPTSKELNKMEKSGLSFAISEHGGFNHFREKMGHDIIKRSLSYWTDETIISELESVINELSHFPTQTELNEMDKNDLIGAISKNGGLNYFRKKSGYEPLHKPKGYWTDEIIISELESIIERLGHFPVNNDLIKMDKGDLAVQISKNDGFNYFREKMGHELIHKPKGYWTNETIISELESVIDELGHFPSRDELTKMGIVGLVGAIATHGGIVHFMEKCGISPSMQKKIKSKLASYVTKRGYITEQVVKDIITEWTEIHNKPAPNCNVKLSKGNILEFVCDHDKKIGIDVTNTKSSTKGTCRQITNKWRHKDYCLHLDELWIVVFTDVLTSYDYEKLNRKSPENVKVFSIDEFLKELKYSTENYDKINRLKECSFHNKDEIINLYRTFDEEYKTMPLDGVFPNT